MNAARGSRSSRLRHGGVPAWIATVVALWFFPGLWAAEPAQNKTDPPAMRWLMAQRETLFERLFGPPSAEEKKALAGIEIPVRQERQMGQSILQAYLDHLRRQNIRVVRRGRDLAYLRDLLGAIQPLMSNKQRYGTIQVYLADSPRWEARSFPGGSLVFFRGLLESAGSEAALVGVIGHELSHLDRGHLLERARRVKLAQQVFSGKSNGISPEQFLLAGPSALRVWARPFQPEDELQADRDGASWAYQAGYDPREMARLLLDRERRQAPEAIPLPSFLRSHPPAAERQKAVLERFEALQRDSPKPKLYIGRENLRRRIPRSRQEFPE
ncbi:MAG: M48 family metalloprotease [Thermoguttaceae bacterium]